MKRAIAAPLLLALPAWCAGAPLFAAPPVDDSLVHGNGPGPAADIQIDPAIAKASAEADADAGLTEVPSSPQTAYEKALLNYKSGKYDAAKMLIDEADQDKPGDVPIEMLKVRILMELHDFTTARQVLNSMYDRSDLTPAYAAALELTTGDLALRQRKFDAATKAYETYLQSQPNDPDGKLRLIYARLGVGDFVTAGKLSSELKPLDASTPAYYFAHAAMGRSGASSDDEEENIQQARTIYGITVTNRYLKTYLEVFSDKNPAASAAGDQNNAPSGKAQ